MSTKYRSVCVLPSCPHAHSQETDCTPPTSDPCGMQNCSIEQGFHAATACIQATHAQVVTDKQVITAGMQPIVIKVIKTLLFKSSLCILMHTSGCACTKWSLRRHTGSRPQCRQNEWHNEWYLDVYQLKAIMAQELYTRTFSITTDASLQ